MTLAHALLGFTALVVVLTLVPGLDTAVVLRSALSRSRAYGLAVVLGIGTGLLAWGAAAGVGATAILTASRTAYRLLSVAGAVYLLVMGVQMLVRSLRSRHGAGATATGPLDGVAPGPAQTAPLWRGWLTGLTTNLLNPKAGVFYLATIPQFMAAGVPPLAMGVLLALVHVACCTLWLGSLALGASWLAPRLGPGSGGALERWTDRVTGTVLVAFGARLLASARA